MATPADLYGRVFGSLQSMTAALVPIVTAVTGFVIEGAGLVPMLVGLGVVHRSLTLGLLLIRHCGGWIAQTMAAS